MNQGEILVVPIQVQALCIGSPDSSGPNFALRSLADFTTLPYVDAGVQHNRKPYISADVVSRGGPFEGQITLPTGIHLHWALPAGLTHGQQQPDGSIVYPNVPNRWLVTRLVQRNATSSNPTIDKKSWVVESDRLNLQAVSPNGMHQPTVPTDPSVAGQNFRFIGQAFELNEWAEDPQAEHFPNLTAVGYGEASFASYYPNCSSVFGFYDNPSSSEYDYNHDTLAYQVSGWYSDSSKDPAANGIVSGDNPYGWTFGNSSNSSVTNSAYSGLVDNIRFNSSAAYISQTNTDLTVAIGPSSQEALSALMANQEGVNAETTELVLNALQFGLLTQLGTINGTIQNFEELVHEAGFSNKNAGTVWQVRKKVRAGSDDNYEGEVTLPEPIAQDLNALNVQQSELDELKETLASKRWQLFSDWYKYLVVEYETKYTPQSVRDQAQSIREYLLLQVNEINNLQSRVEEQGELQTSINTLANFISGLLDDQYELTNDVAAPRYWQANNPFLVLQGDDIAPVNRTGSDETLACRISQYLVSVTQVEENAIQNGQHAFTISFIVMEIPLPSGAPQQLLNLMLNDAVLMSYALQPAVAALLCSEYYKDNSLILDFTSTQSVLQTGVSQFIANEDHPQTSYYYNSDDPALAPDPLMIFTWSDTPWLPMLVEYEVEFKPVQYIQAGDTYPSDFITTNFSFDDDDIELTYNKSQPTVNQLYKGTMLLSAAAQVDLSESIRQFMLQTESTDNDLQTVLDQVSSMPILAQELSGLNQSMLMRQEILQMKVADPLANTFDQPFVAAIRDAVADESVYSPEFNASFNPIRTGTLRIHALRLVDAFGRFKDFNSVESVHVAKGILPPPALNASAGTAFLPPRITQPARLLFRWLSADNDAIESNSHPATSPIIGWVLPDYPDNSLFIYNADGTPLGEMAISSSSVLWFAAPGGAFPLGTDFQTVMENQLPWLRNFATGIYNNGNASLLSSLINSLRTTAEQTMPAGSSNNTAGLLIGQPLAITRANLQLDLAGDPAANESWDSFAQSLVANDNIDTAGFTEVKFPVQLGQSSNLNDGLFAYWIQENTAIDFTQVYTPQSSAQGLSLTTGYTRGSIKTVLMLVDPKGEVHANTGILPVKSIAIPSDQYDAALNSLSVTFLTAPVLSGSNTNALSIPLPKIDAGQWSWVSVSEGEWQSQNFQDDVQNANQGALDYTPQQLLEGWLRLRDFEN